MTHDIRNINCTQCGAPLQLHGGHKVRSLTCGYCGSVMDSHQDYQVVKQYGQATRSQIPAKVIDMIGRQAHFKGVKFTVIGVVRYTSESIYHWIDFQLFSPTHGYAWLTWENGHHVVSYRTRLLPSPINPTRLQERNRIYACGHKMRFYERYQAKVSYVSGELTWIAEFGDVIEVVEAIAPPYTFSYEKTADEYEYYIGEYLDAAAFQEASNMPAPVPKPRTIHPAQPYCPRPIWVALSKVGKIYTIVALLALLTVLFLNFIGHIALEEQIITFTSPARMNTTKPFTITDADHLLKLDMYSPVKNAWSYYDISVIQADNDAEVLSLGKEISYYEGYEGGEYWSEGSTKATALFKVPQPSQYYLELYGEGSVPNRLPPLTVSLYEGSIVKRYFLLLLLLTILSFCLPYYFERKFEKKRWAAVTEDDEDD